MSSPVWRTALREPENRRVSPSSAQIATPWLVNAKDVKHLPGRPKTDRLDAVWLAKVAERQMIRPSFVPPPQAVPARADAGGRRGRGLPAVAL